MSEYRPLYVWLLVAGVHEWQQLIEFCERPQYFHLHLVASIATSTQKLLGLVARIAKLLSFNSR